MRCAFAHDRCISYGVFSLNGSIVYSVYVKYIYSSIREGDREALGSSSCDLQYYGPHDA